VTTHPSVARSQDVDKWEGAAAFDGDMSRLPLVAALAALLVLAVPAAAGGSRDLGACSPDADLVRFSDALNKTTFEGTAVGGLSALVLRGHDRARALVDNQGTTDARFYDLELDREPSVRGVTTLRRPDGTPYTGATFDGEGLVELRDSTLLASSETEPSIRRFSRHGREIGSIPVPERFRVAPAGQAANNLTLEGLGLSDDGRDLWAGMEGPLAPDGFTPTGGARVRFLHYERHRGEFELERQVAYFTDPALAVTEVQVIDDDRLLVLERGFRAGFGNTVRVYQAFLAGAGDVNDVASLADPGVRPAGKRLVFDLGQCPPSGATNPGTQPNPLLDNVEAMTLSGRRRLHLLSDDNFGAGQVTRLYELSVRLPRKPRWAFNR
jgi:hypothetical protein